MPQHTGYAPATAPIRGWPRPCHRRATLTRATGQFSRLCEPALLPRIRRGIIRQIASGDTVAKAAAAAANEQVELANALIKALSDYPVPPILGGAENYVESVRLHVLGACARLLTWQV